MQIFGNLKHALILILISFTFLYSNALDLPIKNINGKDYYFYKVQPKETIYSITHKLNISKEDIIKYNPSVADGLRAHDTLYFPVPESKTTSTNNDSETVYREHTIKKGETLYGICKQYNISAETLFAHNPQARDGIKTGFTLKIPQQPILATNDEEKTIVDNPSEQEQEQAQSTELESEETITATQIGFDCGETLDIAILLPFMLDEEKPSKQASLYTEFYKGFLIAVDELKNNGTPVNVYAYDTADSLAIVKSILNKPELKSIDIIIAPNNEKQIKAIGDFAENNNCCVLNLFDVKNTLYKTNKNFFQANIPQSLMYDKAINYFIDTYKNHTPVFLQNNDRKSDKAVFLADLKVALDSLAISYIEIPFAETLVIDNLNELNDSTKYVFVPSSGSRSELASVMNAISQFSNNTSPENINLFGYPEWTTFTGHTRERMIELSPSIYSRFYLDTNSPKYIRFYNSYKNWYNEDLIEAVPSQGVLGYDTGKYIISDVQSNNGYFSLSSTHDGLQHSYNSIQNTGDKGYFNNSLFIIKFLPNDTVIKTRLE